MKKTNPHCKKEAGFNLLEVMVAIAIAALGILGIMGHQTKSLQESKISIYQTQAIRFIEDFSERLVLHPSSFHNAQTYISQGGCSQSGVYCDKAIEDVKYLKNLVESYLPDGSLEISKSTLDSEQTKPRILEVKINWNIGSTAYSHKQNIALINRCLPQEDKNDPTNIDFYCASTPSTPEKSNNEDKKTP